MNMTIEEFYGELMQMRETSTLEEVEVFLTKCLQDAAHGCKMCFNPLEISVCNELGLLYRSTGEFKKSEEMFVIAQNLIETHLGRQTIQYAAVLNNLGGTYKLAGRLQEVAQLFDKSALIYESINKKN